MSKKLALIGLTLALIFTAAPANAAVSTKSASGTGPSGQKLTVSNATNLTNGQKVSVTGKNYDQKLGIYVAFCEIPAPNTIPENCYGGINMNGKSSGSIWISSNPPLYGKFLAKKFKKNGSFSVTIKVASKFGNTDCKIVKCGIITRADHTHSDIRSGDVLVPVTFK